MERKSNNGFISFLLIIIILLMIIFGLIFSGVIKINGPIITIGNAQTVENTNTTNTKTKETSSNELVEPKKNNETTTPVDTTETTNTTQKNDMILKSDAIEIKSQKSSIPTTQILSYYEKKLSSFTDNLYSVSDINNDSIPELLIFTTGTIKNQIVAYTMIYTYDEEKGNETDNYIVYAGQIDGRIDNNTMLYKMNDSRLLSVYGHMGYEVTTYYKLVNDWIYRDEFSEKKLDNKNKNDYATGDQQIEFKKTSDKSLIKNYK